jgi:hypothetical protein
MHYFPQLESGAMGQYPLRRVRRLRTVRNQMADGREVRLADVAATVTEWRLEAAWLTDGELERLAAFFEAVEGRLHTFTFLDPADNLLRWSEDLEESVWEKGPLVAVAGGVADPFGGMRGWRVANGSLAQRLMVPEWFYYTVSVYARCDGGGVLRLLRGSQSAERRLTPEWKRLSFASQSDGTAESRFTRFPITRLPISAGRASAATSLTIASATFVEVIAAMYSPFRAAPGAASYAFDCAATRRISCRTRSLSSLLIPGRIRSRSTPARGAFCVAVNPVPPAIRAGRNSGFSATKPDR